MLNSFMPYEPENENHALDTRLELERLRRLERKLTNIGAASDAPAGQRKDALTELKSLRFEIQVIEGKIAEIQKGEDQPRASSGEGD